MRGRQVSDLRTHTMRNTERLIELAKLFLKLGLIGFGGPAAHIAMMEDEVVRRRNWLTGDEFLDLLGATNLIPGPNSTEMAIFIGYRRGGWAGLVVAGTCFIVPAMLIVLGCGWGYVRYGKLPQAEGVLYGIKPVIIGIVVQALWGFGRTALKNSLLWAVGIVVAGLNFFGGNELVLLFCGGLVAAAVQRSHHVVAVVPFSVWALLVFFLKVGSVLYGSGYVLLAFLRSGLVERLGWMTEAQLLDAVAVGQITPGPVFTTATFIGYVLGGMPAALVATLGIFLPAFVFVALSGPLLPRIRRSKVAGGFLDGVNAASLALMLVVTVQLAQAAFVDWVTIALGVASAVLLLRWRVNSAWLVLGGASAGFLARL
ncbi:MAG TPA: chromate transporter [Verrucomicrobiae bacterium]|nr:chromate transporter [Verrucomicrobiae bacterium]